MEVSTTVPDLSKLSRNERKSLLDGPSIQLIITSDGTYSEYLHQLTAAKGVVGPHRFQQLQEQSESPNRPFNVEFPVRAFAFASPTFTNWMEANPGATKVEIPIGDILPGFVMDVLDWLVSALRAKEWRNFVGSEASVHGSDQLYYFYPYFVMRMLGMSTLADNLFPFLQKFVDDLAAMDACVGTTVGLLHHAPMDDPVPRYVAMLYAVLVSEGKITMSESDVDRIDGLPWFAEMFSMLLAEWNDAGGPDDEEMEM